MADVAVGDLVQIKGGGRDVTNGKYATAGRYYGEGGPWWATVELIDYAWPAAYGTSSIVTKVRCVNGGTCVWQVEPQDIADNVIKMSTPEIIQTEPEVFPDPEPEPEYVEPAPDPEPYNPWGANSIQGMTTPYVTPYGTDDWANGNETGYTNSSEKVEFTNNAVSQWPQISAIGKLPNEELPNGDWRELTEAEKADIGAIPNLRVDGRAIEPVHFTNPYHEDGFQQMQMLDEDPTYDTVGASNFNPNIQNANLFPVKVENANPTAGICASYDFQLRPQEDESLQSMLMKARAALGLPVHGDNSLAKAMKFNLYNRFKTPDPNLAHHKEFTHIFFTRPDCNLLVPNAPNGPCIADQAKNHTESALIWRRYPELFKLLCDGKRMHDNNNFNLLLSNQVDSFPVNSETLTSFAAGNSWGNYEMAYGGMYSVRGAGEFSCTFDETSDYAITNLMKLWMTYIDNVSRGAWSPSYNLSSEASGFQKIGRSGITDSHVHTKTIDYGASAYMFIVGPDGEDILYFTKYYGVFPMSTGASAHSWNKNKNPGDTPQLDINFKYSFKRDMSPISLIEFNNQSLSFGTTYEDTYDPNYAGSVRPFTGIPFVEMTMFENGLQSAQAVNRICEDTTLRLKFRPTPTSGDNAMLSDSSLYMPTIR